MLSIEEKRVLGIALGDKDMGESIGDQIPSSQADSIAALGTTSNLVGVDGTGSNAAPLAGTESRLDAIESKIDALIQALKDAGVMAS